MAGFVENQPGHRPMMVPGGVKAGLACLESLSEVKIHQQIELLEVALGWEKNNKYRLCTSQEQQIMYAKEDTDCCTRQCFGPMRPFTMDITDNGGQCVIQLDRPCRCQGSCMWCCCMQEMDVMSPPGVKIGDIKQLWTCWTPKYQVNDSHGNHVFTLDGECCYCACFKDIFFRVSNTSGEEIGNIVKHWSGCMEILGGANDFSVRFPQNLDIQSKALLLGATFLMDFNYFERKN